jgi:SET domain-containing protein
VFALEKIYEGEIIEICPVIDMGLNKEPSHILIDYRFNWPQGLSEWEKQVVPAGYGMLYNHSNNPNVLWRSDVVNNTFEFYAIKEINPNEEILTYYGSVEYWSDGRSNANFN